MEIELVTSKKAEVIFWFVVVFLLSITTIFPYATDTLIVKIFIKIILGCSAALWVYVDSKQFKEITQEKANAYSTMCFILPEIVGPIYTFSSRGFKVGIISSSKFLLKAFIVTFIVVFILSIFGYE